jgi:hypothetical protein
MVMALPRRSFRLRWICSLSGALSQSNPPRCISHIALHGVSPEKIKAGLNSIRATGVNNWPEAKGEAIYRTQNGLVMFFRGNVLMSAFEPGRNIDRYFRDRIIPGTRQVVKRWRLLGLLSG